MALISCPECGKQISDKAATCPHCGIEVQKAFMPHPYPQHQYQPGTVTSKPVIETRRAPWGIISLALSIVSCIIMLMLLVAVESGDFWPDWFIYLYPVFYTIIPGLLFSIIGLKIVKRNRQAYTHKPTLVISLVLSIVSILLLGLAVSIQYYI